MQPSEPAYLEIRLSTDAPGTVWATVPLTEEVTYLGRPEPGEPGVDLQLEWVSRKHARLFRECAGGETVYHLENWRGRSGIRVYERLLLQAGDSFALGHCYTFQIPGVRASEDDPYFSITLYFDDRTKYLSIQPGQPPHFIIFGQAVRFTSQEYDLLAYLFEHRNQICPYAEVIAALWAREPRGPEQIREYLERLYNDPDELSLRREALDALVSKVRRKLRGGGDGPTLIETIRGGGPCLRP